MSLSKLVCDVHCDTYIERLLSHTAQQDCSSIVATFHCNITTLHKHCKMLQQSCCKVAAMVKCPLSVILFYNIAAIMQ